MIKYYCDVCGKEICGEFYIEFESSTQSQYRGRSDKKTILHFHDKCLRRMLDYLAKGEEDNELEK